MQAALQKRMIKDAAVVGSQMLNQQSLMTKKNLYEFQIGTVMTKIT